MSELLELGKNACDAKYVLQKLTTEEKNKALQTAAMICVKDRKRSLQPTYWIWKTGKTTE